MAKVFVTVLAAALGNLANADPVTGKWQAELQLGPDRPNLRFGLELQNGPGGWQAWLCNDPERIAVPRVRLDGDQLTLGMDHFDSTIVARISADGRALQGEWKKRRSKDEWAVCAFRAIADGPREATALQVDVSGRWLAKFATDSEPAVAIFQQDADGAARGTFLTTTGDYRYLAGRVSGETLELGCFDGAHAFAFRATRAPQGELRGDFWSGSKFHDTWSATRDESATLPDGFGQVQPVAGKSMNALSFPDLDGQLRRLDEPALTGAVRVYEVFGSWCPNCHDAGALLSELDAKYAGRGVRIVGLAFELTGDARRDAAQVRTYAERHGIRYPLLLAGVSDKKKASAALPVISELKAYPTLLFADASGGVRAVYTGFCGAATGAEHTRMREQIERLIEKLLAER